MPPSVFISYSHDDDAHKVRVLELARALLQAGWDVRLDRYSGHPAEGWPRWIARQLREADQVVCVCTPTYRRRFDGEEKAGGLGVSWEGHLISAELYGARGGAARYLPAFPDAREDVPLALRARAVRFDAIASALGCVGEPRPEPPIGGGTEGAPHFAPVRPLFRLLQKYNGRYAPSDLLRPEFGVVGHFPRPGVDDVLDRWCANGGIRVGLMTGGGGSGKTRSALELARRRQQEGWRVGPLVDPQGGAPPADEALASLFEDPIPLLLIVDYAEIRTPDLARVLNYMDRAAEKAQQSVVVRVLLLARSKGKWWDNLAQGAECLGRYADGIELQVPRLPSCTMFGRHAAQWYGALLETPVPAMIPEEGATPLERQVDALLAVYGDAARGLDALLRHEDKFVVNAATSRVGNAEMLSGGIANLLPRAVALATLAGGLGADALKWLTEVRGLRDLREHEQEAVFEVLRGLYPDGEGGIAPLRPDRLGERLVFREARNDPEAALLKLVVDRGRATHLLTVLTRLVQATGEGRESGEAQLLDRIIGERLESTAASAVVVAIQTGDPIGPILASQLDNSRNLDVVRLVDLLLPDESVGLTEVGEVCSRLLSTDDSLPMDRPRNLNNLAVRLAALGRDGEALDAATDAVARYRNIEDRSVGQLLGLCGALNTLSNQLSRVGRRAEALEAAQEAITILKTQSPNEDDRLLRQLTLGLETLSARLSDSGRSADGLVVIKEAVAIHRRLGASKAVKTSRRLARTLSTLSLRLREVGQLEDALTAIEEACDDYRELAEGEPDSHLPALAGGLNNLAVLLSELGRSGEGLEVIQEAAAIYRRLARARPESFLLDLGRTLINLSGRFGEVGQAAKALTTALESVNALRQLGSQSTGWVLPELALALNNVSVRLAESGREREAVLAVDEAVEIYRGLEDEAPGVFSSGLARALLNSATHDSNGPGEALAAIAEAVAIYERLEVEYRGVHLMDLVVAQHNLTLHLLEWGDAERALVVSSKALEGCRELVRVRPEVHRPLLAKILRLQAIALAELGRESEALGPAQESVRIRRDLPDGTLPGRAADLAASLDTLVVLLCALGRTLESFQAADESVMIYRQLAAEGGESQDRVILGRALCIRAYIGRYRPDMDALRAAGEAMTILQDAAFRDASHAELFRACAQTYAELSAALGKPV